MHNGSWDYGDWEEDSSIVIIQIWNHASFIVGICGNVFLLYATVFHKALKIDGLSVWIVQNLALADLLNCVFVLGVVLVSFDSGRQWVFGEGACTLVGLFYQVPLSANVFLLCALSVNKLLRCLFPFRYMVTTKRAKITISAVAGFLSLTSVFYKAWEIWVTGYLFPAFNNRDGICIMQTNSSIALDLTKTVPSAILMGLFTIISSLVLVVTNTAMVVFAARKTTSQRGVNRRNLLVLAIVSAAFVLSILPIIYTRVLRAAFKIRLNPRYRALGFFWSFINAWINPIIHMASSSSLRKFTGGIARRLARRTRTALVSPFTAEIELHVGTARSTLGTHEK